MKILLARLFAALFLIVLTGCANLSAIQEFGALSADAAGYTKLTNEFASSPTRTKLYTFAAEVDARKKMDESADARKGLIKAAFLYQATLSEYMAVVADLAGGQAVSFDAEIGGLADAALAQNYIKANEAAAVKSIGSIVASAATDFYRQRKLTQVIGEADPPVQVIVTAMVDLVGKAYVASLTDEQAAARSYYRNWEQRARNDDKQPAAAERIYAEGAQKQVELAASVAAARSYVKVLQNIGAAHHALYEQRDKVSDAEVQRQVKQYVKKIWAAYKATREESGSDGGTASVTN